MHFPDRKTVVRAILLFGSTLGVMCYSLLTTRWFHRNFKSGTGASKFMLNLSYCFLFHTVIGAFLLFVPTTSFVKKRDSRAL